jgi:hypothetical protein
MRLIMRLYRLLAQAFPHEFKLMYGEEVIQLGEDALKDIARQYGILGILRMVLDLAVRIPIEYLSEIRRDLAYALRTVAGSPGFAITAILSLGMGIGVASFAFSEIHAFFFQSLPLVKQPQQLASTEASYPYFERYREQRDVVSGAAACMLFVPFSISLNAASGVKAERIYGQIVSPEYFQVLGIPAAQSVWTNPVSVLRATATSAA